jgi:hypothetical protein
LIEFYNIGVRGVTKDIKALFTHVINSMNLFAADIAKKVPIAGQPLEDLFGLLRLMRLMVETS